MHTNKGWFMLNYFLAARLSRQDTGQLAVPGNAEQKSSTTGGSPRKKKSMGIRALSGKQRKDDNIRALLIEHLGEIHALLQLDKLFPVEVSGYKADCSKVLHVASLRLR